MIALLLVIMAIAAVTAGVLALLWMEGVSDVKIHCDCDPDSDTDSDL